MASSEIEICNAALALVGETQIESFGAASEPERQCEVLYPLCRDALLRAHPWNFAEKYEVLAQSVDTPPFEFNFYYNLPADCIRVLRLHDSDAPYRILNGRLATDASTVNLIYTYKVTNPGRFDAMFTQALIFYLAAQLSIVLANKPTLHNQLMQSYDVALRQAKQYDGQEGTPLRWRFVDDWRIFRRGDGFGGRWPWSNF